MRYLIAVAFLVALGACKEKAEYSVIGSQGTLKAISISTARAADRTHYQLIIDAECPRRGICILAFFEELSSVSYPLSDMALDAQIAQYNRNPNSGLDRLWLACRIEESASGDCI